MHVAFVERAWGVLTNFFTVAVRICCWTVEGSSGTEVHSVLSKGCYS